MTRELGENVGHHQRKIDIGIGLKQALIASATKITFIKHIGLSSWKCKKRPLKF